MFKETVQCNHTNYDALTFSKQTYVFVDLWLYSIYNIYILVLKSCVMFCLKGAVRNDFRWKLPNLQQATL